MYGIYVGTEGGGKDGSFYFLPSSAEDIKCTCMLFLTLRIKFGFITYLTFGQHE